jgi:hypothetical protein
VAVSKACCIATYIICILFSEWCHFNLHDNKTKVAWLRPTLWHHCLEQTRTLHWHLQGTGPSIQAFKANCWISHQLCNILTSVVHVFTAVPMFLLFHIPSHLSVIKSNSMLELLICCLFCMRVFLELYNKKSLNISKFLFPFCDTFSMPNILSIVTEGFHGYSQSLQANYEIVKH